MGFTIRGAHNIRGLQVFKLTLDNFRVVSNGNNQQSKPKKDKKKKDFTTIKCWFCNKPGHTQIECFSRKNQGKPLTWRNKEIKSKFHNNKTFALVDLENVEEMKEWTRIIEEEAQLMELPKTQHF